MKDGYEEYIKSDKWKTIAEETKRLAGYKCQVCNSADKTLYAHHRTYARQGSELQSDLICLCEDCHKLFHDYKNKDNDWYLLKLLMEIEKLEYRISSLKQRINILEEGKDEYSLIPFKTQPPKEDCKILCYVHEKHNRKKYFAVRNFRKEHTEYYEFTHWIPLPEPPESD